MERRIQGSGKHESKLPPHRLEAAIEALVEESHYRELSPVTAEIYRKVSGHLVRLLGAELDINTLVDEQVRQYGRQRKDEGAQSGTIVKEMIALRRALGVAKERGHFAGDPMA